VAIKLCVCGVKLCRHMCMVMHKKSIRNFAMVNSLGLQYIAKITRFFGRYLYTTSNNTQVLLFLDFMLRMHNFYNVECIFRVDAHTV